jgi:hypothetical protein
VQALADMSEVERKVALERYKLLEPHLQNGRELRSVSEGSGVSFRTLLSRCTQFPESRFFVFNLFPGFECMVVALKPRNSVLKPRTKFRLKFVRDLNAKTNLSHFLAAVLFRDLSTKHSADSGI